MGGDRGHSLALAQAHRFARSSPLKCFETPQKLCFNYEAPTVIFATNHLSLKYLYRIPPVVVSNEIHSESFFKHNYLD